MCGETLKHLYTVLESTVSHSLGRRTSASGHSYNGVAGVRGSYTCEAKCSNGEEESYALPNLGIKSLLCHSYFLALTSSITFVYRLMLYACLLSLLGWLPISTSLSKCPCYSCYHLLALTLVITLLVSCCISLGLLFSVLSSSYLRTRILV